MSQVSICNMALGHLGARPIAAIDEESQEARYCNIFWDNTRDEVLREYPWNFANASKVGGSIDVPTVFEGLWSFAYLYPVDCVQVRAVTDDGSNAKLNFHLILEIMDSGEQRRLVLTEAEVAVLHYTARVSNTAYWDAKFTASMALNLASKVAIPITKNADIAKFVMGQYIASIPKAKVSDFKEDRESDDTVSPWEDARLGG